MGIETLSYEEFYELSDEDISNASPMYLLDHARTSGDDRNFQLTQLVHNFQGDSERIDDSNFDRRYNELRRDDDPEKILGEYSRLVTEFYNK